MKVYFLSYFFPPLSYPRSIQVARLAKFSSLSPTVVCGLDHSRLDAGTLSLVPKEISVIRIPRKISWLTDRLRHRIPVDSVKGIPDQWVGWAIRRAKELSQEITSKDVLVTFGNPMSDHVAGVKIKEATGCKWIAHFSDPWTENPYWIKKPKVQRQHERLERKVLSVCDQVLFTNEDTLAATLKKYPADWLRKAKVLNHCFDASLYLPPVDPAASFTVRHIGNFYGSRSPHSLLKAVEKFRSLHPEVPTVCELVGGVEKGTTPHASFKPSVNYLESLRLMTESDVLVVIDSPAEKNLFFPSKLADYIGAERPLLALTSDGPTKRIVESIGGWVCALDDIEGIAKALFEIYQNKTWKPQSQRNRYDAQQVAREFDEFVTTVSHT